MSDIEPTRPRLLTATDAARYCGIARASLYATPGFPTAIRLTGPTGKPYWDVRDLDAWIDRLKAEQERDRTDAESAARTVLARARLRGRSA